VLAGTIGLVIVWELTEASFGIQTAGDSPIIRKKSNMDGAGGGKLPMIPWLKGCDTSNPRRDRARQSSWSSCLGKLHMMQQSNDEMRSGIKLPGAKVVNGHLSAR
jgi:hypothetical protein